MSRLFEKTSINNMPLSNRFVRSATAEIMANEDGACTEKLTETMAELARGKVGLIMTGHTFVIREGKAMARQLGIDNDSLIPGLRKMVEAVHKEDGKIAVQLAHSGFRAPRKYVKSIPLGPSEIIDGKGPQSQAMSPDDIGHTIEAFAEGARRAGSAEFDGVQLHAAHSYLISQFLSPYYNKREDEYGGNVENRARFLLEILKAIRSTVGNNYPMMIKINSEDFLENGFTVENMLQTVLMLEQTGIDAVELSGGAFESINNTGPVRTGIPASEEDQVYYRSAARRYKEITKVPLMLVGGIRSMSAAEKLVKNGVTDYISMSRPFIREPDLIAKWMANESRTAACISDGLCLKHSIEHQRRGMFCGIEDALRHRQK